MKYLLAFVLLSVLFLSCEKTELTPVAEITYESVTWQLDALVFDQSSFPTFALNSDVTLRFSNGKVQTNGDFCYLREDLGVLQETDYDPVNQSISYTPCIMDADTLFAGTWAYEVDQFSDYLFLYEPRDSAFRLRFLLREE